MLKSEDRDIAGTTYRVNQFPFTQGRDLLKKLLRMGAPVFGTSLQGLNDLDASATLGDIKPGAIGGALSSLLTTLSGPDLDYVDNALTQITQVNVGEGRWVPLKDIKEVHFAGKYADWIDWMIFALEVNYRDFFSGQSNVARLLTTLRGVIAPVSISQATSTGTSSGSSQVSTSP